MATAREGEADFNQSPVFTDVNLFTSDTPLREAVAREGAADAAENLTAFGRIAGSAAAAELGRQANENPPRLRAFDAQGRRLDRVDYHPAYHRLMGSSTGARAALLDLGLFGDSERPAAWGSCRQVRWELYGGADGGWTLLPHHHDPCRRGVAPA